MASELPIIRQSEHILAFGKYVTCRERAALYYALSLKNGKNRKLARHVMRNMCTIKYLNGKKGSQLKISEVTVQTEPWHRGRFASLGPHTTYKFTNMDTGSSFSHTYTSGSSNRSDYCLMGNRFLLWEIKDTEDMGCYAIFDIEPFLQESKNKMQQSAQGTLWDPAQSAQGTLWDMDEFKYTQSGDYVVDTSKRRPEATYFNVIFAKKPDELNSEYYEYDKESQCLMLAQNQYFYIGDRYDIDKKKWNKFLDAIKICYQKNIPNPPVGIDHPPKNDHWEVKEDVMTPILSLQEMIEMGDKYKN